MFKTRLLPALAAIVAIGGSTLAAQASPPVAQGTMSTHAFTTAERNQLASEAGITPQQAQGLTIDQLAWLKARRDSDDGAYFEPPTHVSPSQVHS